MKLQIIEQLDDETDLVRPKRERLFAMGKKELLQGSWMK